MKMIFRSAFLLSASLLAASAAHAVIVYNGDNAAANTTAPADDPGWSYVGANGGAGSFVYLGNYAGGYWAISAAHVINAGTTSVTLNSNSYGVVSGSVTRILDSGGGAVDLTVFRLDHDPGLANLNLASTAMTAGTAVTYVGYGLARATARSYWTVDTTTWSWSGASSGPIGANAQGYQVTGGHTKSWGANSVVAVDTGSGPGVLNPVNIGYGATQAFSTTFNGINGSAVLFAGDSGGATFAKTGGVWELVGINDALGTYTNQPGSTAIVGDGSYSTDIFTYRSQILAAVPEPSTYGLLGAGALAVSAIMRRRRRS